MATVKTLYMWLCIRYNKSAICGLLELVLSRALRFCRARTEVRLCLSVSMHECSVYRHVVYAVYVVYAVVVYAVYAQEAQAMGCHIRVNNGITVEKIRIRISGE